MDELTEQLISPSACSTGRTDGRTPGKECPADATADAISCHLTRRRPSAFARRRVPRRTPKPGEEESAPVVVRVGRARAFGVGTDETRAGWIMYFERRERGASFLRSRSAVKSKRRQEEGGREEGRKREKGGGVAPEDEPPSATQRRNSGEQQVHAHTTGERHNAKTVSSD